MEAGSEAKGINKRSLKHQSASANPKRALESKAKLDHAPLHLAHGCLDLSRVPFSDLSGVVGWGGICAP